MTGKLLPFARPAPRGVVVDPRAAHGATVAPEQISGDAGFVQKHEVRRVPVGAATRQSVRARATSGRSCSDGRTVFFNGDVQSLHGAPDRRQTGRRAKLVLQLHERAIRLLRDQRGQGVQVRLKHGASPVPLDAGRHLAGFTPPLFQQPHPRPTHAVTSPRLSAAI